MSRIPIILDTDIGTDIDDTWALAMLLGCPELDPRLIVTVEGDTVHRAHLVAKFLQTAGRTDIPIGIGLGHHGTDNRYQAPWLEGYDVAAYPGVIRDDGVRAMVDLIMSSAEPVTIVSIGIASNPLSSIAVIMDSNMRNSSVDEAINRACQRRCSFKVSS